MSRHIAKNRRVLLYRSVVLVILLIISGLIVAASQMVTRQENTTLTRASESCWVTTATAKGKPCDIPACNQTLGGNPGTCPACNGGWCEGGYCRTCGNTAPDKPLPTAVNNPTVPAQATRPPEPTADTQPTQSVEPTQSLEPTESIVPPDNIQPTELPDRDEDPQPTDQPQPTAPRSSPTRTAQGVSSTVAPERPTRVPSQRQPSPTAVPTTGTMPAAGTTLTVNNQDTVSYRIEELKLCSNQDDCIVQNIPSDKRVIASMQQVSLAVSGFCNGSYRSVTAFLGVSPESSSGREHWMFFQKQLNCGGTGELILRQRGHANPTVAPTAAPSVAPTRTPARVQQPRILPRSAWNAKAPDTAKTPFRQNSISRVIYHHIGSGAALDYSIHTVQHVHMSNAKYDQYDIAYHYIIAADGSIYTGRDTRFCTTTGTTDPKYVPPDGAACGSIQVLVVGDFDKYRPTEAQITSLIDLSAWLLKTYNLQSNDVFGHRDFITNEVYTCPGNNLYNYRKNALGYIKEQIDERL